MLALVFGIALIIIGLAMIASLPQTGLGTGSIAVFAGVAWILIWWKEQRNGERE